MVDTPNKPTNEYGRLPPPSDIYVSLPIPSTQARAQYSSTGVPFKDNPVPAPQTNPQYSSTELLSKFKDNEYGPAPAPKPEQLQKVAETVEFKPRNNFFKNLFVKEKNSEIDDYNTRLLDGKYNKAYEALKNTITSKGVLEDSKEFKKNIGDLVNKIIETRGQDGVRVLDEAIKNGNRDAANAILAKTNNSITQEQMPRQQTSQYGTLPLKPRDQATQPTSHYTLAPVAPAKSSTYHKDRFLVSKDQVTQPTSHYTLAPAQGSTTFQDRLRAQGQQTTQRQ